MTREEKNEISRQRILIAAIEEFGQNDYSLASTNSICKNHNISKGLMFHHFKNKDEIFLSCISKCINELVLYIKNNYSLTCDNLETNLENYFLIRQQFFQSNPYYSQIFNNTNINTPKHLIEIINNLKLQLKELNTDILKGILSNQSLKNEISEDEIIKLILNFSDYLMTNQQEATNNSYTHHVVTFIKMLFYGVIDSKED